jgi:integrase
MAKHKRKRLPQHVDRRVKMLKGGGASIHYFFRPLGLVAGRLPSPDDPEFLTVLAQRATEYRERHKPNENARTIGELRSLLKSTPEWAALSHSQKKSYERGFEAIKKRWPDQTLLSGVMDHPKMRGVIQAWFESFSATPATANMHKATLSRLLAFGLDRGLMLRNLALGVKRIAVDGRASIVWTPEQITQAADTFAPDVAAVVLLAYATGQRQSDLLSLTWNDVTESGVTFRPSKQRRAKQRLYVPMYDELREALARCHKRGVQVLTTANGQPWNVHTFRHEFKQACRDAELSDALRFHDIRGSALKAFADAGASELEIRAISGHSMKSLPGALGSYIDSWRSLAEGAVRKRENARRTKTANRECKPAESGGQ